MNINIPVDVLFLLDLFDLLVLHLIVHLVILKPGIRGTFVKSEVGCGLKNGLKIFFFFYIKHM